MSMFNKLFFPFQDGGDIGEEIQEYTRESWEVSRSKSPLKVQIQIIDADRR